MYEIIFDDKAICFLEKLDKKLRKRIFDKIIISKSNPHHYFTRLASKLDFKLRVGDYRVVADIDPCLKRIEITLIGHRKNVYEREPSKKS